MALTFWLGTGVRSPILGTLAQPVPMPTGGIPSYSGCREWLQVVWRWGRGSEQLLSCLLWRPLKSPAPPGGLYPFSLRLPFPASSRLPFLSCFFLFLGISTEWQVC